jgi:hypothetical protein
MNDGYTTGAENSFVAYATFDPPKPRHPNLLFGLLCGFIGFNIAGIIAIAMVVTL